MRLSSGLAVVPLLLAAFASQQEPPWCFRPHGAQTARCDYYSLNACLAGTLVFAASASAIMRRPASSRPASRR